MNDRNATPPVPGDTGTKPPGDEGAVLMPSPGDRARRGDRLVVAHVLFMDIVGYSRLLYDQQRERLAQLQKIVRATEEFSRAQSVEELISLPTGDGMALVFFGDPESPLRCALEIARSLQEYPELNLRMGIHSGPVYPIEDINANRNVAGGGINIAQRVMDCGDTGHILLSERVADDLGRLSHWAGAIHDLGEVAVKHGVMIHVFNFYRDGLGNSEKPAKFMSAGGRADESRTKPAAVAAAIILVLALCGLVGILAWSKLRRPAVVSGGPAANENAPARTLSYWVMVQKYRGGRPYEKPFRLFGEMNFEKDYRIRLNFISAQSGHLYLINEGPALGGGTSGYNIIFPTPTANGGSSELTPNRPVQVPEQSWLFFDEEKGTELLWVVWSAGAIAELESLKVLVNEENRGAVEDPTHIVTVRKLISKFSASKPTAKVEPAETLTVLSGEGDVLLYPIRLVHN